MQNVFRKVLVGGVAAVVSLTSCAIQQESEQVQPSERTEAHNGELSQYYDQDVVWGLCSDAPDFECSTVQVPLDYDNPQKSIEVHVTRDISTNDQMPVLFNPGGPGSSGVDFVQDSVEFMMSDRLAEDISAVGFDPRGVARSEPIICTTDEEFDESREEIIDTSTKDGWDEAVELSAEYGELCLERSGDIVKFSDTISAAKDLDILRASLDRPQLNYFGISYGTKLGATYAELFPQNVGKFVLDSVLTPSADSFTVTMAQSVGFEQSFEEWSQWCAESSQCSIGEPSNAQSVRIAVTDFFDDVEQEPLRYPNGRVQPLSDVMFGIILPLYSEETWPHLAAGLEQAMNNDFDGDQAVPLLLYFADLYHGRDDQGEYTNNSDAFSVINCLDYSADERTFEQAADEAEQLAQAAPIFGPQLSYSTGCAGWPVESTEPFETITAAGSNPIVLTSLTSDPATPIEFSHELAQQLENSVHVTVEGSGHGAYSRENKCIIEAIDGYLLDDVAPDDGLYCDVEGS